MRTSYIKVKELNEMLTLANTGLDAPKVIAYGYDVHNRPLVGFLRTDKETKKPVTDKNGNLGINWRPGRHS